ncbi:MAG TPA: acetylxylan esterase [Opitutus sp.]|nr:acetylxylan esterase [Opitutus sp.]
MRRFAPPLVWSAFLLFVASAVAQPLQLTPRHASGIYAAGETVGWDVTLAPGATAPAEGFAWTVKENNFAPLKSGVLHPGAGAEAITVTLDHPAMVYLEIAPAEKGGKPMAAGAAVAPTQLRPVVPRPADFDAFWANQIEELEKIPVEAELTPGDSGKPGVEYATIRMNNIRGAHIYGQIAKPAGEGKHPAMLILQWAGGPYPLQKSWVVDRAAEGWLALNIEPHDVPGDLPKEFYAALPTLIKHYTTIYNDDRDRSYFLRMYLGDYRAAEYLASRPDWDGKILVATGTSMGGQQSFAVSGLEPKITHMIVLVPAGADTLAALHGRHESYPDWAVHDPKVAATAPYFDTVNFASRIRAKCLVALGFIDNTSAPAGVWTEFNEIKGPKEAVPLVDAKHNNLSTPAQLKPYTDRSAEWFAQLARGEEPAVRALPGAE